MKKIILAVALCAASTFTFAQQGVMEVGGSLGINTSKTKMENGNWSETSDKTFGISIMPSFMYYMTDNIAVGGQIGFSYNKQDDYHIDGVGTGDLKTSVFAIEPRIRYKKELGANFSWAPEFYIGFGFGKNKMDVDGDTDYDQDIFSMGVGIHFARFEYSITDKWVVSANFGNFGYSYSKVGDDPCAKTNNFGLNILEDSSLGIAYRF